MDYDGNEGNERFSGRKWPILLASITLDSPIILLSTTG